MMMQPIKRILAVLATVATLLLLGCLEVGNKSTQNDNRNFSGEQIVTAENGDVLLIQFVNGQAVSTNLIPADVIENGGL